MRYEGGGGDKAKNKEDKKGKGEWESEGERKEGKNREGGIGRRKSRLSLLMNLRPLHEGKIPFGRGIMPMTRKISSQIPHEAILPTIIALQNLP